MDGRVREEERGMRDGGRECDEHCTTTGTGQTNAGEEGERREGEGEREEGRGGEERGITGRGRDGSER